MRLTLDLDKINIGKLKRKAKLMFILFGNVEVNHSNSNKGFHIISHNVKMDFNELQQARIWLNDDEKRIAYDNKRKKIGIPYNVLFDYKKKEDITANNG